MNTTILLILYFVENILSQIYNCIRESQRFLMDLLVFELSF